MANINDFIQKAVVAAAGKVDSPSNIKDQVLGGLGDSILGSLTQTASKAGGLDEIKNLLTGKTDAAKSSITAALRTAIVQPFSWSGESSTRKAASTSQSR